MSLGRNIAQMRRERGFARRELAERSGISEGYLKRVENEKIDHIHIKTLVRIAWVLDVDTEKLGKYFDETP